MPKVIPGRVTWLSPLPKGDERRPIIRAEAQHAPGSNRPTISTSPLSSRPHRSTFAMIPVFHGISRAEGPFKQTTKNDGLSYSNFGNSSPAGPCKAQSTIFVAAVGSMLISIILAPACLA